MVLHKAGNLPGKADHNILQMGNVATISWSRPLPCPELPIANCKTHHHLFHLNHDHHPYVDRQDHNDFIIKLSFLGDFINKHDNL